MKPILTFGFLALLAPGCGSNFTFSDEYTEVRQTFLGASEEDGLSTPYVTGSQFWIDVRSEWARLDRGFTVRSEDDTIFRIDSLEVETRKHIRLDATAVAPGNTTIELLDRDDDVRASADIEILTPNMVTFRAAPPLFQEQPSARSITTGPTLLVGGQASFMCEYFADNTPLNGDGVLWVSENLWTEVSTETTTAQAHDVLRITVDVPGTYDITASFAPNTEVVLPVYGVDETEVAAIELVDANAADSNNGDFLVAVAEAVTADAEPIYGMTYDWEFDGGVPEGEGDIFRYELRRSASSQLTARFNDLQTDLNIASNEGEAASSNDLGCDSASRTAVFWAFIPLLFAIRRRKSGEQGRMPNTLGRDCRAFVRGAG